MKTLLIGKGGQLGAELTRLLTQKGWGLMAFNHREFDVTDDRQVDTILKRIRPDIVINASAYNIVTDCEVYPQKAFAVNAFAVKNLASLCRDHRIKFVTYSTDYVFDGTKGAPYTEADCPRPLQTYGVSKLAGEFMCLNSYPDSIIIRTCGVYGGKKGSRQKRGNFVLSIITESRNKSQIEVSKEQIVSPTCALDLAAGTVALVEKPGTRGIYHLINENYCSWYEFAKEIITLKKLPIRITPIDRKGEFGGIKRPLFSALANTRAKAAGIVLPSWQDGLKRYISHT